MLGGWRKLEENCPAGYTLQKITYGTHEQQEIYLTLPAGKKDFPLIIWFHGGGLTGDEWQYPSELWNGEYGAAIIRHRTSGGPFNALDSLTDSVEATAWVLAHLAEIGVAPEKVFLGGLSAGGWLSAMIGMNPELLAKYGFDNKCFAGLLLVSGQMTTHFQLKKDLGYNSTDFEPVIDQYAPIRYASKDLPPVIHIRRRSRYGYARTPRRKRLHGSHPAVLSFERYARYGEYRRAYGNIGDPVNGTLLHQR